MSKPIVIGIAGSHSGVGKTTLAAALLKCLTLPHLTIASLSRRGRWGAIKYTKTAFYSSIIDDNAILSDKKKDTGKLLDAGAEDVLWVQSPESEVQEVLSTAMNRLSHLDGIIIEGNTAIEFLKPDIVIFIEDPDGRIKPSAKEVLKQADIIIKNLNPLKFALHKTENNETAASLNSDGAEMSASVNLEMSIQELSDYVVTTAKEQDIEVFLREKSMNSKITCSEARKIAEELGVAYIEVGRIANKLHIKIKNCELGCF